MEHTIYVDKQGRYYTAVGLAGKKEQDTLMLTLAAGAGVSLARYPTAMLAHMGLTPVTGADPRHVAEIYARSELRKTAPALAALRAILGADHKALRGVTSIDEPDPSEVIHMHYIFNKAGEFLSAHKNSKEAGEVLGRLPEEARAKSVIVAAEADMAGFSIAALTTCHNDHVLETARVSKFKDKVTGAARTFEALQLTFDPKVIKAAEQAAAATAKAAAKAEKQAAKQAAAEAKAADKAAKAEQKAAAGGGERAPRQPRNDYAGKAITALVELAALPCREGTLRRDLMERILTSPTVDEAVAADVREGVRVKGVDIKFAVDNGWAAVA